MIRTKLRSAQISSAGPISKLWWKAFRKFSITLRRCFRNSAPLQEIYERWIAKFGTGRIGGQALHNPQHRTRMLEIDRCGVRRQAEGYSQPELPERDRLSGSE